MCLGFVATGFTNLSRPFWDPFRNACDKNKRSFGAGPLVRATRSRKIFKFQILLAPTLKLAWIALLDSGNIPLCRFSDCRRILLSRWQVCLIFGSVKIDQLLQNNRSIRIAQFICFGFPKHRRCVATTFLTFVLRVNFSFVYHLENMYSNFLDFSWLNQYLSGTCPIGYFSSDSLLQNHGAIFLFQ